MISNVKVSGLLMKIFNSLMANFQISWKTKILTRNIYKKSYNKGELIKGQKRKKQILKNRHIIREKIRKLKKKK